MSRVFGIELRRSAALGTALVLLVIGTLALYFAEGIGFATGWMQLAMSQRLYLALLWPLALAAGAWQARREHRSNVGELFASTPRPRAQRIVPTLGAMAVAVVCGYLGMAIAGGLWIFSTAGYLPVTVFVVVAVGALSLIAAAWLGLAVGRLVPTPVTAPALGIAGLAFLLFVPFLTRPRGWLALVFSPIYEMNMPGPYNTVPGRVSAAQAVWLVALAGAAVLLLASGSWRLRVAALLPVVAGVALAVVVIPQQDRIVTDSIDPVARALVCTDDGPRVCVSRIHSGLLPEVAKPAQEGLAVLAKLPGAPTEVHEDTYSYPNHYADHNANVALVNVEVSQDGHLGKGTDLAEVVGAAFATSRRCNEATDPVDRIAAAYWLMGREPVAPETSDPYGFGTYDPETITAAVERWRALGQLPAGEAEARVTALRKAALDCAVAEGLLTGGKS